MSSFVPLFCHVANASFSACRNVAAASPSPFAKCEVLKAHVPDVKERQRVVSAVEFLLARKGVASSDVFAREMSVMPFRIGGFVSVIAETVNLDGYDVLRFDPASRQVHLDVDKLAQLFEVKL